MHKLMQEPKLVEEWESERVPGCNNRKLRLLTGAAFRTRLNVLCASAVHHQTPPYIA